MTMHLNSEHRSRLREIRREVLASDHVLSGGRITVIQQEILQWPCVPKPPKNPSENPSEQAKYEKFTERFDLYDSGGNRTGAQAYRAICHWLWLRNGCVHGMLFTPTKMAIFQRRAASIKDSPGFLDMTFAGHTGVQDVFAAAKSEAKEEVDVDIDEKSDHVKHNEDLQPICRYDYIGPPRTHEEFYNAESRHVFAIRITDAAMGAIQPLDSEVSSFVMAPIDEAWAFFRGQDIASALRVSGPHALYHALRNWGWGS